MPSKVEPNRNAASKRPKTGGRQRGTPNRLTQSAREAFQFAFDALGGADALAEWARQQPHDFYRLYARMIPSTGPSALGPQTLTVIRRDEAPVRHRQSNHDLAESIPSAPYGKYPAQDLT